VNGELRELGAILRR